MEIQNNLTEAERLSIIRLYGHDAKGPLGWLGNQIAGGREDLEVNFELMESYYDHTVRVFTAIEHMSQERDIALKPTGLGTIKRILEGTFETEKPRIDSSDERVMMEEAITYSVLFNLVKNAYNAGAKEVRVSVERVKTPREALHYPCEFGDFGVYHEFRVEDDGRGFKEDFDSESALGVCPPKNSHGYGLYFTGLASKLLKAPIDVKSKPGKTRFSFYHPL